MIEEHIEAMRTKNMSLFSSQFSDDAVWVNTDGYYYAGKQAIADYHKGLFSMDYHIKHGKVLLRMVDDKNALVYFPWRMDWYTKENPNDTTVQEIGLMTLSASKRDSTWKWIAVTVQDTKEFFEDLENHTAPVGYNE
jgi:uncharacterized protein (TIGR02246 family)